MRFLNDEWHEILDLNLVSATRINRIAIPAMQKQGGGAIIMITSIYGREGGGHITYNAAKAAEISMSKSLAKELAPDNIRVNSIAPGSILFPGVDGIAVSKRTQNVWNLLSKAKCHLVVSENLKKCQCAVFLASERASLITGACINEMGVSHDQISN